MILYIIIYLILNQFFRGLLKKKNINLPIKKQSFLLPYSYSIFLTLVVASLIDIQAQFDILSFLFVDF